MPENEKPPKARDLVPSELPQLITFIDPADQRTARKVNPNDLATSFGPNVCWHRIHTAPTTDRVTTQIVKKLPWIATWKHARLDGGKTTSYLEPPTFAFYLTISEFKRED